MDRPRVQRLRALKERVRDAREASFQDADRALGLARVASEQAARAVEALSERLARSSEASGSELELGSWLVERARGEHRAAERAEAEHRAERDRRAGSLQRAAREVSSLGVLEERLASDERAAERRREVLDSDEAARRRRGER